MPRVLKLSDDKIETLFDAKDFEYLIDKYMGYEASSVLSRTDERGRRRTARGQVYSFRY